MTNLQLVLTIGIPSLLILVGMFLNNSRSNTLEGRPAPRLDQLPRAVAQLAEQAAHNGKVGGSIPSGATTIK